MGLLILMRHGKSDWSGDESDEERPLAKRGRRQTAEAGQWIAANVDHVDLAVVSPAERTRSTWDIASGELNASPRVRVDERVYAGSRDALLDVVHELPDDASTVVVVGHNPGLEDLVETLVGTWVPMPTSALAVLDVPAHWSAAGPGTATLRAAGRPPSGQLPE